MIGEVFVIITSFAGAQVFLGLNWTVGTCGRTLAHDTEAADPDSRRSLIAIRRIPRSPGKDYRMKMICIPFSGIGS